MPFKLKPLYFIRILILAICFSWVMGYAVAQNSEDDIIGVWITQSKESMVEVSKSGNTYIGKILWLKFPNSAKTGKPKTDIKNPDEKLRSRSIQGLLLMKDFKFSAKDNVWDNGTIYDPKSGSTYKCKATLADRNTLNVRGYVGASWMGLGRTEIWKRVK